MVHSLGFSCYLLRLEGKISAVQCLIHKRKRDNKDFTYTTNSLSNLNKASIRNDTTGQFGDSRESECRSNMEIN